MSGTEVERQRTWRPDWPCSVTGPLRPLRRGAGDPTFRIDDAGHVWRGTRTPEGPATLRVGSAPSVGEVRASAWGPGAEWVLDSLPGLLGAHDDWSGFEPRHPVLEEARRRHPHLRTGRTGLVMEALVPAIIEQKVTGQEAFAGFRMLVHRFGERAPGPGREMGLRVQPDAATLDFRCFARADHLDQWSLQAFCDLGARDDQGAAAGSPGGEGEEPVAAVGGLEPVQDRGAGRIHGDHLAGEENGPG